MIDNQKLVPNLVKALYALPPRSTSKARQLIEDKNGNVSEQEDGEFEYRVARKINGINSLKDTLNQLNLEVVLVEMTKTENGKTVSYVALQVHEKGLNNRYEGLTAEERRQFDTLIATGSVGFNLAKAIVKGSDLNAARESDNQAAAQEAEAANQEDNETKAAKTEKLAAQAFIQAQLDEVFVSAVDINNSIRNNFEGALSNFESSKILTADQEKALFGFIKHTYGSVDWYLNTEDIQLPEGSSPYFNPVHEILKELDRQKLKQIYYKDLKLDTEGDKKGVIDKFKEKQNNISQNEKLALIREVEKVGIDVSKLNQKEYTDGLTGDAGTLYEKIKDVKNLQNLLKGFQTSTVTKDNVKEYAKL